MAKENSLVIGMGQIGTALYRVLHRSKFVFARDILDTDHSKDDITILHIAFPYSETFVKDVQSYIEQYNPELVIVYSTVPVGTCVSIGPSVVHSPVEGRHPDLENSILLGNRWLACSDPVALERAYHFWRPMVKMIRTMQSASFTEWLKLRSTSKFGINLVWTQFEHEMAEKLGIHWSAVKEFDQDYNRLYQELGYEGLQRYILDPPNGVIGGHCVVPNAELLNGQYPSVLLDEIIKMKGSPNGF